MFESPFASDVVSPLAHKKTVYDEKALCVLDADDTCILIFRRGMPVAAARDVAKQLGMKLRLCHVKATFEFNGIVPEHDGRAYSYDPPKAPKAN